MSSTSFLPSLKRTDLGNVRRSNSEPMRNIDWILMLATLGIAAVGLVAIYSTSRPFLLYRGFDPYTYTQRQVIFLVIGAFVMAAVMSIDYGELKERAGGLYLLTIIALLAVLIAGTGPAGSGANAWFDLGPILVQPSEFAKVTVLVLIAGYLADERTGQLTYARFISGLILVGVPVGLVMLQPDFGTASVFIALAMGVLLVAGANYRYILFISVLALATIGALIGSGFVKEYQVQRLTAFTVQNTDDEQLKDLVQQVRNSKRAIATGGLSGKGYLNGPLTNGRFIPVQWTDFVFSGIAEQFGLIGTITLLMLYFFVLFRIWRIARLARDDFGLYICVGAMTMIAWHVFENMGMTMGIMPVTGIPLPLVSYGGSSTIATLAMIGLVQNVHMRRMR
ncbi:MAG: FtsW/RodA/SpoVE family cell cycle protein [Ilumatobacteraceae bacterium]